MWKLHSRKNLNHCKLISITNGVYRKRWQALEWGNLSTGLSDDEFWKIKNTLRVKLISFVKESDLMDGIIIEFKVNCETDCFTPYRLRGDKNKPNGEITVNNTIINIKENIKIEDLIV